MSFNDPKYHFYSNRIMHVDDEYLVPTNEPCMVLRGKDIGALAAICSYIRMLEGELTQHGPNPTINSHLDSSLERLEAFYQYQISNPDLQSIGCSQKAHTDFYLILNSAKELLDEWS